VTPVSQGELLKWEREEGVSEGVKRGDVCRFDMYKGRRARTGKGAPEDGRIVCAAFRSLAQGGLRIRLSVGSAEHVSPWSGRALGMRICLAQFRASLGCL
jgi:hypothetical protein